MEKHSVVIMSDNEVEEAERELVDGVNHLVPVDNSSPRKSTEEGSSDSTQECNERVLVGDKNHLVHVDEQQNKSDISRAVPYGWIFLLKSNWMVKQLNGERKAKSFSGTGFKIHIPQAKRSAIVTAAHNIYHKKKKEDVYDMEGYAIECTVAEVTVTREDMYVPSEYIEATEDEAERQNDYALVLLPSEKCQVGFGWTTLLDDVQLEKLSVTVCGFAYQGTKMMISGGMISRLDDQNIWYEIDTLSGQSGSPIYAWHDGHFTVVGIHVRSWKKWEDNCAVRLTREIIVKFLDHMRSKNPVSLSKARFSTDDTHQEMYPLYCHDKIVCWQRASDLGRFYIIPVQTTPSVAHKSSAKNKVVIACKAPSNKKRIILYLRNTDSDNTELSQSQYGSDAKDEMVLFYCVNIQQETESFVFHQVDSVNSEKIQSVLFDCSVDSN